MASDRVVVLPGDVSGNHDGGAEFAQGPRKCQQHPADDSLECAAEM